jgi:membrane fusion protein (multidrug efflux system)
MSTAASVLRETAEDSLDPGTGPDAPARAVRRARPSRRTLIVGATALAIALGGTALILAPANSQSTDDAYVRADATSIAPKVRGLVAQVLVKDNQSVKAGDPLVRIDAEEFDARLATARAEVADAEAGVASAQAALISLDAEERLASANVRAAQSTIRAARAQAAQADADDQRYQNLEGSGAVATHDVDRFHTAAITARQDAERIEALYDVSRQNAGVIGAKRATLLAGLQKSRATVARAHAALDLALQDQRHSLIVAPIDGVVGDRQVRQGDYVQPGSRLLTLVPLHDLYVIANYKETQTGHMRPGQHVTIRVDALSGEALTGIVESLAPGSGSSFSLLPFEPGTGNFTKIVQRVPVRIRFDADQPALEQLRPGLSVTTRVALR